MKIDQTELLLEDNLRRISAYLLGKKCHFCDIITPTLLFQWLLQGVFLIRVFIDNGLERTDETLFLFTKRKYVLHFKKTQYVKTYIFNV